VRRRPFPRAAPQRFLLYSTAMEPTLRQRLSRHAGFVRAIRSFFDDRGYVEADTPTLAPFLIPEPAIEVFATELLEAHGRKRPLWLIPSPELWMKRLLAAGSGSIYQVSRSFRNGDTGSPHHSPEFRLLEWYTVGADYRDSIAVTEDLFSHLLSHARRGPDLERLSPPFHRITMAEAFQLHAGIRLEECQEPAAMREAGLRAGIPMPRRPTWEEAFHIAFLTAVEPALPRDRPVVITDYPRHIPTTARALAGTPWSERWELYVDGVEVANCYTEETDPAALAALVGEEAERKKECRVQHAADPGLAGLFPPGFPTCSGVALGVDRLEMAFMGEKTLEGVIFFPISAILDGQSGIMG
jgi:elongation factor P--(R)-beta-lysine ligase